MPNPIQRQSLNTPLEQRYKTSKSGGSFNAKTAGTPSGKVDFLPNDFANGFTSGGNNTNLPKKDSSYLKGHNTRKYKG